MAASTPSLYRRHRPRTFAEVVGQEPVVTTLRHAVQREMVHHAYLFVGSRGTGKTSMAKILASCLNCERGPTVEPCGTCDSCRSIATATSLDVIEMDAASNNSVEDIRELRESVMFTPVSGRHKLYILDEAHMLSQAAWNAFLKTLEEPPPRTVFVLATTEAAKVPATVVDRCHRFDFQRPTVEQIASVLTRTALTESIEIPPQAVAAIARAATGSFRDALGTLEQLVTYSGTQIVLADVLTVLGVADEQLVADTFDAIAAGDARSALLVLARCADGGHDATSFARDLEARARELLVVQTLGQVPRELSLTPEIDERLSAQASRIAPAQVVRTLEELGGALEVIRAGGDPRTQLELALVKAAAPQTDGSTKALLARIERLEQALAGGQVSLASPLPTPLPTASASSGLGSAESASPSASERESVSTVEQPAEPTGVGVSDEYAPVVEDGGPAVQEAAASEMPAGDFDALWSAALESVKAENELLWAVFSEASPESSGEHELTLAFPANAAFLKRKAEDPANRAILADALHRLTGLRYRVSLELREDTAGPDGPAGAAETEEQILARLVAELDAEELAEDWLVRQKGD